MYTIIDQENKITIEEYYDFLRYYERHGRYYDLRLGQCFIIEKYPCTANPTLFYESSDDKAKEIILEHYVK